MSNEVNVSELFVGTLDPGAGVEIFVAYPPDKYNTHRKRARFFSVSPDPGDVQLDDTHVDMEITRTWNTVWVGDNFNNQGTFDLVFQLNCIVQCGPGGASGVFHLLVAETDN